MSAADNKKISELSAATVLAGTELIEVVQGGVNVRTTVSALGTAGTPSDADFFVKTANAGLSSELVVTNTATLTWDYSTPSQAKANVVVSSAAGIAPSTADYLVKTADSGLSAERVVTDTASVTWDWGTAGQAKASVVTGSGSGIAPSDADYFVKTATGNLSAELVATDSATAIWDYSTAGVVKLNVVGVSGLPATPVDFKDSVAVATTAAITLSGEQTIDGVLTSASRVLVKNQASGATNGIYVSGAGAWSRATDADTSAEVTSGMLTYVEAGTVSGGLVYMLSTTGTITLGTTALTFTAIALPGFFFVGTTVAGTTYTTVLTDTGKRLNLTSASAKTITVPPQSSVNYAVNTEIEVFNAGAGVATLAAGAGVTLNSADSLLKLRQYDVAKLKKRANANTWDVTFSLANPIEFIIVACSDETTALTTGTAKVSWNMPYAFTLTQIPRASLVTAQTSGSIFTVDINEAGTSIISTKLTIGNAAKTSVGAATPAVSSDTSLADDALMTVDIDQIGDGTAKGLKICLVGYRT